MPRKLHRPNYEVLAQDSHLGGGTVQYLSHFINFNANKHTHWVSQPTCLHFKTPSVKLLSTCPHRHPFNASASCLGTLFLFDCPISSTTPRLSTGRAREPWPCPQGPGSGPGLAGPWLALKGQGPVQGRTGASPGPLSIVGNTYKFLNYTPNIYQIQIYLLNYIS